MIRSIAYRTLKRMPRAKREGAAKGRGHKALKRKSDMKGGLLSWPAARKLAEQLRAQTLERAPAKCEDAANRRLCDHDSKNNGA